MPLAARQVDNDHEKVVFCNDPETGLRAIIAVHDTTLGPSLGGVRMWPYASEGEALEDVLRLSRGMTYKSAVAGLALGGGKAVIIGDSKKDKSEDLFRAFGRFVNSLNGRYIAAEDVGTSVADLEIIARETEYAAGLRDRSGDPSPVTAYGVYQGIRAAAQYKLGASTLRGLKVAVQGLGHVGQLVCKHVSEDGADLIVADIDAARVSEIVNRYHARAANPSTVHASDADIFGPCALGAVLNDQTIRQIQAAVVAGAANNQLAENRHGLALRERGILYAPDYVINSGGVINISYEFDGYDGDLALQHTARIHETLLEVFERAQHEGLPTNIVADRIAEERLAAAKRHSRRNPRQTAAPADHTMMTI